MHSDKKLVIIVVFVIGSHSTQLLPPPPPKKTFTIRNTHFQFLYTSPKLFSPTLKTKIWT